MPEDPLVWIVAIVVGGVVVVVALALGGVVDVGIDPPRLSFKRKKDAGRQHVSVLEEAEIEDAELGAVTGVARAAGAAEEGGVSAVDVARKVKIKGGKIDAISGVVVSGESSKPVEAGQQAESDKDRHGH